MELALVLFPRLNWRSREDRFDIRRERNEPSVQQALNALNADLRISEDGRNHNMVLLSSYLQGFETSVVPTDQQATQHYEPNVSSHWKYAATNRWRST